MKKKLSALAVACAFAPAIGLPQDTHVTIYGKMELTFENVEAEGTDAPAGDLPSRNRVSSNTSHIGFRGIEDLGNGLKAIFQCESNAPGDTGGGTFCSRNSNVGLSGNWGTLFYGIWDTPLKLSTGRIDPFGINIGDAASMFRNGGAVSGNVVAPSPAGGQLANYNNRASFHRRQQNSVQYWTPPFGGFSARFAYGANEEKETFAVSPDANPYLWSGSAIYEQGPFFVTGGYEFHHDYGGDGFDDDGWSAGAGFRFGATTLAAGYSRIVYEFTGGAETRLSNWIVSATHTIGPHVFRGYYQQARDPKGDGPAIGGAGAGGTDGGAKQFVIGYGYVLSKRTELYVLYTKISNDDTASYDFGTNAIGNVVGVRPDADPQGFALGIKHTF
jgi:predicted porin